MRSLLKSTLFTLRLGLLATLTLSTASADEAVTIPRGIYVLKVPGKPADKPQARTYFGVQLLPDVIASGPINAVAGNTLKLANLSSYTSFQNPQRKCYVHITSGNGRGFIADIAEFRENDALCETDLQSWIQPGDTVIIRPHSSLADLFGSGNRHNLASGPTAEEADNVVAWDPETQQEQIYYFHSTRLRWEKQGIDADASLAVMRFPYGLYIIRRSPGTLRIAIAGDIGSQSVLLPVRTGMNVFSLPVNLSASVTNLISSNGAHPIASGANAKEADLLIFEEPYTGNRRGPFYHSSRIGATGWREVGVDDSNAPLASLDLLSTLMVKRNGPAGYVLTEGSLAPGPGFPETPAEPGEVPLTGELELPPLPPNIPGWVSFVPETSKDLQTWTPAAEVTRTASKVFVSLPAGESRSFYRFKMIAP